MFNYRRLSLVLLLVSLPMLSGCSNLQNWRNNNFKVGPEYVRPAAHVNEDWVPGEWSDQTFDHQQQLNQQWWKVFNDPVLDRLIEEAYQNNLDVKAAVYRVVQANQIQLATAGNLFPQSQFGTTSFTRQQASNSLQQFPGLPRILNVWTRDLNLSWELDLWGRIRRSIIAADASLDASIEDLDAVLVTLVADVAQTYVELRAVERRLSFANINIKIQTESLRVNQTQKDLGKISRLDVEQAKLVLRQTEAAVPQLKLLKRQLRNRLSILIGRPPLMFDELLGAEKTPEEWLEEVRLPDVPETVVVGIPADLLRRRPDIRRTERFLAAQSEQIGITTAELYPTLSLNGSIGLSAPEFSQLFSTDSVTGFFSPGIQWNILNYGRIWNRIKAEGAAYLEGVTAYQKSVLVAQQEAEDAMAGFIYSKQQKIKLGEAVAAAKKAAELGELRQKATEELFSYNQLFVLQSNLVQVQDQLVLAELEELKSLIQIYKALGGGWEVREMFECLPAVENFDDPDCYERKCLPPLCDLPSSNCK